MMKKIVISGASGFVGSALVNRFKESGDSVATITRGDLAETAKLIGTLEGCDVLINLSGANIINRWSDAYKKLLYSSRIDTTRALLNAMEGCHKKPKTFISTSAVGVYKNDRLYDETTADLGDDFLARLCQDWEREALRAESLGVRTAVFRFGIVLGREGGALGKMMMPFKLGLGGTIGDGSQAFSFIHMKDLVRAYRFVIDDNSLQGIFNLTAPNPTTNKGLTEALGRALHRPTFLPVPQFVLNLLFGEGAKVLTDGQSTIPKKLLEHGFVFDYATIDETVLSLV
jgi:uncharacterized protein (TIGR01777 family)